MKKGVRMDKFCLRYDISMYNPVYDSPRTKLLLFVDRGGDFLTCHLDYYGLEVLLLGLVHYIGGD